jgi:hypothetical protein
VKPTDLDPERHLAELRAALHRDAEHCEPIGLGAETVQRRGRRRRNRGRSAIAVCSALCLGAAGVTALHHQVGGTHVAVGTRPGSDPAPTLDFRVVNGSVDGGSMHFTSADGLTYELSTAPGSAGSADADPGQAIYTTRDGEHWTTAAQDKPWIADLTEGGGVLYAIGTAPGASASDVKYHLATSHDGGQAWSNTDLPFSVTAPSATVTLSQSSSVQVARGASTTAALLTEQFWPDLDPVVAAHYPGNTHVGTRQTADGFAMLDLSKCVDAKARVVTGSAKSHALALASGCKNPPVLGTIPWSELGLSGPDDLVRTQMLVSSDGTNWTTASAPDGVVVRDLAATDNGFLLLADSAVSDGGNPPATRVYRSTDANQWTAVSTPPGLNVQAIADDDIVGTDSAGNVETSTDAGASWSTTSISAQLPAGSPAATVAGIDAGPLGFAVLVNADANPNDQVPGHDYLLFSTDGVSWNTTDLAAQGAPTGAYLASVTVGADHVAVDYESSGTAADPLTKLTTLLGTPQR